MNHEEKIRALKVLVGELTQKGLEMRDADTAPGPTRRIQLSAELLALRNEIKEKLDWL